MPKRRYSSKRTYGRRYKRRKTGVRSTKRKRWGKRYTSYKRLSSLRIKTPSGIPDRMFVRLKANFGVEMANNLGLKTELIVRCNDLFDPLGSAGSVQPYYFDQWAAFYFDYQVFGFSYKVTANIGAVGVTSTDSRRLTVAVSQTGSAFSDIEQAINQPYARTRTFQVNVKQGFLKGSHRIAKMLGISEETYRTNPVDYGALCTQSPTATQYIHFITDDPYPSATTKQTNIAVECTFYAMFFLRQIPSNS